MTQDGVVSPKAYYADGYSILTDYVRDWRNGFVTSSKRLALDQAQQCQEGYSHTQGFPQQSCLEVRLKL